jgi:hypothetical protein
MQIFFLSLIYYLHDVNDDFLIKKQEKNIYIKYYHRMKI